MVDFQSRDTSRGLSDDEEDEETQADEETAETEAADESEDPGAREEAAETDARTAAADVQTSAGTGTDTGDTRAESDSEKTTETTSGEGAPTETDAGTRSEERDASHGESASGQRTDRADGAVHADHGSGHGADHGHEADHEPEGGHGHEADHHHADVEELGVAVVTVSSSRDLDHDPSGDAVQSLVEGEGHSVVARDLVADDLDGVQRAVLALTGRDDVDVVVTTGGTGVTPDDVTVEAVRPLFDKELPGFGELFRILSYEEVGTRALGSRATAGVSEGVPVFCLPGSEDAVRTGVEELILAEAPHLVGLARGD